MSHHKPFPYLLGALIGKFIKNEINDKCNCTNYNKQSHCILMYIWPPALIGYGRQTVRFIMYELSLVLLQGKIMSILFTYDAFSLSTGSFSLICKCMCPLLESNIPQFIIIAILSSLLLHTQDPRSCFGRNVNDDMTPSFQCY